MPTVVLELVVTVSVDCAVPGGESAVGFRLQVGWLVAPDGAVVTAQVRLMEPVNASSALATTVVVLPVVAPALTEMSLVAPKEKSAGSFAVTFTTVEEVTAPLVPVMVTW